jgi:hypothetical protein
MSAGEYLVDPDPNKTRRLNGGGVVETVSHPQEAEDSWRRAREILRHIDLFHSWRRLILVTAATAGERKQRNYHHGPETSASCSTRHRVSVRSTDVRTRRGRRVVNRRGNFYCHSSWSMTSFGWCYSSPTFFLIDTGNLPRPV